MLCNKFFPDMKAYYTCPVIRMRELSLEKSLLSANTDPIPIVPVDPGFTDSQSWGDLNGA